MNSMGHKSKKLNREERIKYLKDSINKIKNLRYSCFKEDNNRGLENIVFDSSLKKPIYSWWTIFWDIIIGIFIRN